MLTQSGPLRVTDDTSPHDEHVELIPQRLRASLNGLRHNNEVYATSLPTGGSSLGGTLGLGRKAVKTTLDLGARSAS